MTGKHHKPPWWHPSALCQAVIPAVCATHETGAIDLVIRGLRDGLITLGPHGEGGCVFTVQAAVLFDVLGEWLG
ncbi:MAG: hypothetical protein JO115_21945 [Pseudonocardiales bacterium]|nr:hypothetical protein [Pseudonocardiales bacterium]